MAKHDVLLTYSLSKMITVDADIPGDAEEIAKEMAEEMDLDEFDIDQLNAEVVG